jgi:hypothetical protein
MKKLTFFVCFIILTSGCCNTLKTKSKDANTQSGWTIQDYKKGDLEISITNHNLINYTIDIARSNETLHLDLNKLKIPHKTPGVSWVNQDFICINNWWSGPFQNFIFIPLRGKLKEHIFIQKDIQMADSTANTLVYIDTVMNESQVKLVAENLLNRKKKYITYDIPENYPFYPYFDSLSLKNSILKFWYNGKCINVSILEIK